MIQNWEALNSDRNTLAHLQEQWEAMLDDSTLKEEDYHQIIAQNGGLFLGNIFNCFTSISKLNLGDDFQTDFIIPRDEGSYGLSYEFIEIESPHTLAFNKDKSPTKRLTRAIQQVTDWEYWIKQNVDTAKRLFPSKSFLLWNEPKFTYTIYISRRKELKDLDFYRNRYEKAHNIKIRSFDQLTDNLSRQLFSNETHLGSSEEDRLDLLTKNMLVNPYTSSYSGKQWKTISSSTEFAHSHSFALASRLFLRERKYSPFFRSLET
ncbi:DUF4263 domain-containing protein [Vibrio parahaemolyticus]|nr:DUF4263 domain-containing protein [Vibrio parahaemolyticus]